MKLIDLHCHAYPEEFVRELNALKTDLTVDEHEGLQGRRYFHDKKTGMTVSYTSTKHFDMRARLRDMEKFGVEVQAVSLALPSIDRLPTEIASKLAALANDKIHDLCSYSPTRFVGFGILPMQDPHPALVELRRCVESLELKGFILPSNVNGEQLDSSRFMPVYEKLSELSVPVLLHPTIPAFGAMSQEYALDLTFGWPFETTLAMARLVYSGVMSKFPNLRIIASHSGGMIPFYRGRINYVHAQHRGENKFQLDRQTIELFKSFYMDTAAFDRDALRCVYSFVGAEKMVFGTDYPFGADEGQSVIDLALRGVNGMKLDDAGKRRIFSGNARVLLKSK